MAELRWILLGLGLLLIGGIWWRGTRGTGQAREPSGLRDRDARAGESTGAAAVVSRAPSATSRDEGAVDEVGAMSAARDWGVPPLEPLTIRTTDFERLPILEAPFVADAPATPQVPRADLEFDRRGVAEPVERAEPVDDPPAVDPVGRPEPAPPGPVPAPRTAPELRTKPEPRTAPEPPPGPCGAPQAPAARAAGAERQKIVTLRICALGDALWPGRKLAEALEMQGLAFGRYQVFHRNHVDGRSLFCVASLIEPGTFDPDAMLDQEFRGITAFAVLPGPLEPLQTVEALIATARRLAEALTGIVQDGRGMPLSPQRAAALREEIARFQSTLS